jgi:hypothetical protein
VAAASVDLLVATDMGYLHCSAALASGLLSPGALVGVLAEIGAFRKMTVTVPPEISERLLRESARGKIAGEPNQLPCPF